MPKITGKNNVLNRKRNTIQGHDGLSNISFMTGIGTGNNNVINVFELIRNIIAAETIIAGDPVNITSNAVYVASNLTSDNKICHGIATTSGTVGDSIKVQIGGILLASIPLSANKDVFLRASGLSHTPLLTASASEDGVQRIGRLLAANILLIHIGPFYQLI